MIASLSILVWRRASLLSQTKKKTTTKVFWTIKGLREQKQQQQQQDEKRETEVEGEGKRDCRKQKAKYCTSAFVASPQTNLKEFCC